MSELNKHFEKSKHPALTTASVAAAAIAIDQLLGMYGNSRRRSHPDFLPAHLEADHHTLAVLPGCQTNSQMFLKALEPRTPNSKLIVTDYPEKKFNIEQICENLSDRLIMARAEKPALFCQSMGGIVMRHFLRYADQMGTAEKLGGFGNIVLDASPFDYSDVRESSKLLATAASAPMIRTSRIVDFLKPHVYGRIAGQMSAAAHLDTIRSETKFMQQHHPDTSLPDVMDAVYYIHGPFDHVVNTDKALSRYRDVTPHGKFTSVLHETRKHGDHTVDMSQLEFVLGYAGIVNQQKLVAA